MVALIVVVVSLDGHVSKCTLRRYSRVTRLPFYTLACHIIVSTPRCELCLCAKGKSSECQRLTTHVTLSLRDDQGLTGQERGRGKIPIPLPYANLIVFFYRHCIVLLVNDDNDWPIIIISESADQDYCVNGKVCAYVS